MKSEKLLSQIHKSCNSERLSDSLFCEYVTISIITHVTIILVKMLLPHHHDVARGRGKVTSNNKKYQGQDGQDKKLSITYVKCVRVYNVYQR